MTIETILPESRSTARNQTPQLQGSIVASLKDPLFQDPVAFAGKATPNALKAAPKAQKAYVEAAVFAEPRAAAAALRTRDAARKARK